MTCHGWQFSGILCVHVIASICSIAALEEHSGRIMLKNVSALLDIGQLIPMRLLNFLIRMNWVKIDTEQIDASNPSWTC